jgi:hypothetical protein
MILIGHEYHIIELDQYGMPRDIHLWLTEQFGPGNGTRWFYRHPKIYFANKKDHLMFLLRIA